MERIKRIKEMEKALEICEPAVKNLLDAIEDFKEALPYFKRLEEYCNSPDWLGDYEADGNGKLPSDLKRGVLSQDTLYDLLEQRGELLTIIDLKT